MTHAKKIGFTSLIVGALLKLKILTGSYATYKIMTATFGSLDLPELLIFVGLVFIVADMVKKRRG
jgi:hypothetical protein